VLRPAGHRGASLHPPSPVSGVGNLGVLGARGASPEPEEEMKGSWTRLCCGCEVPLPTWAVCR